LLVAAAFCLLISINAILTEPEIQRKLIEAGADVNPMSVDQFTAFVQTESRKYLQVIKETGAISE
jgi:tripartite-type tricarboxylate transporter receptor subunit TctC